MKEGLQVFLNPVGLLHTWFFIYDELKSCAAINNEKKKPLKSLISEVLVRVEGLEPPASWSQTYREHFFHLFIVVFSPFRSVPVTIWYSPKGLFPGVPRLSVVIYVVKNASRPVPGEHSPAPGGKRFSFQVVCIVTLSRRLCKWFLRGEQLKSCAAINKE